MGTADQQFCLRWNNHQSTLVSVFDTLLESGTLVDCTLAAEGQYLKAHKVVLSACSPYFEALLSQHYEKHPIVILKDVKFQELKAMMDYMYRGEVNISQDQLGALLKAAESLQIKGLSDSGGGGTEPSEPKRQKTQTAPPQTSRSPPPSLPRSSGLTIEHKKSQDIAVESPHVREGSASPLPRKRRRARRRSSGGDDTTQLEGHETSNSCEIPSVPSSTASIPSAVTPIAPPPVAAPESQLAEDQAETDMTLCRSLPIADPMPVTMPHENIVSKTEPPTELIEPKTEYIEEPNEASVDLTMDDDDLDEDLDHAKPGPSHGGEGSSRQGLFEQWHMTERSSDEDFLNAQEAAQQAVASGAAGAAGPASHRDPQVETIPENEVGVFVSIEDMSIKEERFSPVTIKSSLFPRKKSISKKRNESRKSETNEAEVSIRTRKKKYFLPKSPNSKGMVKIPMDEELLSQIKKNEKMSNRLKFKLKKSMLAPSHTKPSHTKTTSIKRLKESSHKKGSIIKKSFPQPLKPKKTKIIELDKSKKIDTELNKVLASTVSSFISSENQDTKHKKNKAKTNDDNISKVLVKTNTSANTKLNEFLASTVSSFISNEDKKFKAKKKNDDKSFKPLKKSKEIIKEISKAKSSRNKKEQKISKSPSKTRDKNIIKKKKILKKKKLVKNSKPSSESFSGTSNDKSSPISSVPKQIATLEKTSSHSNQEILETISKKPKLASLPSKEILETNKDKKPNIKELSKEVDSFSKNKIILEEKQDFANKKSSDSLSNEDLSFEISQYLSNPANSSEIEASVISLPKDSKSEFSDSLSNRPVSPQNKMNPLNFLPIDDNDSKASPTDPISPPPISQETSFETNKNSKDIISEKTNSNITSQDAETSSNPSLPLQDNKIQTNVPCNDENNKIDPSSSSHGNLNDSACLPIPSKNKSDLTTKVSSCKTPSNLDPLPLSTQNKSSLKDHTEKDTSLEIPTDLDFLPVSTKNKSSSKDHSTKVASCKISIDSGSLPISTLKQSPIKDHPTKVESDKISSNLDPLSISTQKKAAIKDHPIKVESAKISSNLDPLSISTQKKSAIKDHPIKVGSGKISSNLDPLSISTQKKSTLKDHTTRDTSSSEPTIDSGSSSSSVQSKSTLKDSTIKVSSDELPRDSDSLPIPIQNKSSKDETKKDGSHEISSNLDPLSNSTQNKSTLKDITTKDVSHQISTDSDPLPISIKNKASLNDHSKKLASLELPNDSHPLPIFTQNISTIKNYSKKNEISSNLGSLPLSTENKSTLKDSTTEDASCEAVSDPALLKIDTHHISTLKDHTTQEASCNPIDSSGPLPISTQNKSTLEDSSSKEDKLNDSLINIEEVSILKSSYPLPKPSSSGSRVTNYQKSPAIPLSYFKENTPNILKKNILRKLSSQALLKKMQDDSTSRKSSLVNPTISPEKKRIKLDATINTSKSKTTKIITVTIGTTPTNLNINDPKQNTFNLSKTLQKQAKSTANGPHIINLETTEINTFTNAKPISNKQDLISTEGTNKKVIESQQKILKPNVSQANGKSTDSNVKFEDPDDPLPTLIIPTTTYKKKPSTLDSTHSKSSPSAECRNIHLTHKTSQLKPSSLASESSSSAEYQNIIPSTSQLKPSTLVSTQYKSNLSTESSNTLTPSTSQFKPATVVSTQYKSNLSTEFSNTLTPSTSQFKPATVVSTQSDSIQSKSSSSPEYKNIITPPTSQLLSSTPNATQSSLSTESLTPTTSQLEPTSTPLSTSTLANFKIIQPEGPQSDIEITEIKSESDDAIVEILNRVLSEVKDTEPLSNSKSIESQINFRIVEPFASQNNIQFTEVKKLIPPESHTAHESKSKNKKPSTNNSNVKKNQPISKPTPLPVKLSPSCTINENLKSSEPNLKMVKSEDSLELKSSQPDSIDNQTSYPFKPIKLKQAKPSTSSAEPSDFITIHSSKLNAESLTGSKINSSKSFVTLSLPKSLLSPVNTSQILKSHPQTPNTSSKPDNLNPNSHPLLKTPKTTPPSLPEKIPFPDESQQKDRPNTSSSESDNSNASQPTLGPNKLTSPKTYSRKSQPIINKIIKSLNQENTTAREKPIQTSIDIKDEDN